MKTCPFCNAAISDETPRFNAHRTTCSRCGESFADPSNAVDSRITSGVPTTPPPRVKERIGWKTILLFSFPFLALGIAYLIPTSEKMPIPTERSEGESIPVAPLKMKALGYLPAGLDVLIALQQPGTIPVLSGRLEGLQQPLLDATGLDVKEVEELVIGLRIDPLGAFAVIRTKDSTPLADRLQKQKYKISREGGRSFFELVGGKSFLNPVLAQPDPHIIAASLSIADALELAEVRREPSELLRPAIRERVEEIMGAPTFWLVAHREKWDELTASLKFIPALKPYATRLAALEDFEGLVASNGDMSWPIFATFTLKSEEGANRWRNLLNPGESDARKPSNQVEFRVDPKLFDEWKERLLKK